MPRVFIKGGVWKNTEDEVLKAAVMKYGPNQWARVASLLHRKSAKQCKRRWYEWLDPNIKKTEWSREEEEKLLHLAKLMPTQWRTIAPIIGRTPMQCLEHYEQLLDQAQAGDEDEPSAASDARRLRPGEIDPNPHTRPARPDPIDMDEDEKEMLSEARARLANTQGKKAKRKARERQMDEAKRLARLAKFRELRAAGIGVGRRKMRGRNVDYNHEIPFQKLPAPGFFDPGEDETVQPKRRARTRQDVERKPRQQVEKEDRKEAKAKLEELKKTDMPAALRKINRLAGKEEPMSKRSKLALPMPQVSDEDLEDLVKLGKTGADALATASQGNASSALLQDYNETPRGAQTARTPRAPAAQDNILTEAQNILALNQTNSVLEGGENTPLHAQGGSFSGVTPQRQALATPNRVLSTPFRGSSVVATPGRTPDTSGQTPMRDGLGINVESDSSLMTPRTEGERARHSDLRSQLRHGLASLPKPAGEYDIVVPDVEDVAEPTAQDIEDASDADRRRNAILRAKRIAELKRQSQAIQRDLPVPTEANDAILRKGEPKNEIQAADEMVKREMLAMIQHDLGIKSLKLLSQEDKDQAEALLNDEIASVKAEKKYDERKFFSVYESLRKDVAFDPSANAFGRVSLQSNKDVIAACEIELKSLRTAMGQENKKAVKLEKKLKLALGGYQKRAAGIRLCMKQAVEAEESAVLERKSFERLRLFELQAAPVRVNSMKEQLASQEKRQSELQQRYKGLRQQLESLS